MKALTLDALTAKLETLGHLNPAKLQALDTIVDYAIRDEKAAVSTARGIRARLLSRLQAVHDCQQPHGGQFEQLPAHGRFRSWRCTGCNLIITDDDIAPKGGA